MVTSSSPTVFESSTIMVLIAPSSILIFCGRCFFLYSKISWGEKGEPIIRLDSRQVPTGLHHKPFSLLHFSACSNPGFARIPARFPSWDHRQTGRVRNLMLKWNMTCRWQSGLSSEVNVGCLSCPQTLSRLGFGDSLPDDPAGVVHRGGWLELHCLHHVALAHTDL